MAISNPYLNNDDKKEQNWFKKTVINSASLAGTAFGVYGLWKMKGPARRILEESMNKRIQASIDKAKDASGDSLKEFIESVKCRALISDDGFGFYAIGKAQSNIPVDCDEIYDGNIDNKKPWTHVTWLNK